MSAATRPAAWTVLLLGGSAGIGKTMLAERVARRLSLPWAQVDDFHCSLHAASRPADQPALHYFDDDAVWEQPPEVLCDRFVAAASVVSAALEGVVAHHISTASPIVLEGIWLLPALAAQMTYAGVPNGGQIRSVFLLELDEQAVMKSLPDNRWFDRKGATLKRTRARTNLLYSQWLAQEAQRHEVPSLPVQPWASLADRILTTVNS